MKTCNVCNHTSPDGAATCPHCGEASWTVAVVREPAPAPVRVQPQKGKR